VGQRLEQLVCYDIRDDRRRARLVKTLLDFGHRIQESVFRTSLDGRMKEEMEPKITAVIEQTEDSVFVVDICEGCRKRVLSFGPGSWPEDPEYYVY